MKFLSSFVFALELLIVLVSVEKPLYALTQVEAGDVSGTWTAQGSPYIILGDIGVGRGGLHIEPGVEVRFTKDTELYVFGNGSLIAKGTRDQMITFTSNEAIPHKGDWGGSYYAGINLENTDNSILEYCVVEYASIGIRCTAAVGGCSEPEMNVTIAHCIIRNNSYYGIICIAHQTGNFVCSLGSHSYCNPRILFNLISGNGGCGVFCWSEKEEKWPILCTVNATIYGNVIMANNDGGIVCDGGGRINAEIIGNNIILNNLCGIGIGVGIYRTMPLEDSRIIIRNNIIVQNDIGLKSAVLVGKDKLIFDLQFNDVWNKNANYEGFSAGKGDISSDPLFVDATNGNYYLQPNSPCIDAGNNEMSLAEDFDGNVRKILDGDSDGVSIADMGAFEFIPLSPTIVKTKRLFPITMGKIKKIE